MNFSHWGVTPEMSPHFAKRIILTNLLAFTFALNMMVSLGAFIWLELWVLAGITVFFVLTELSWLIFNRFGFVNLSRLGILISSNVLGFVVSVLLPSTGYNRGYYVMVALPFLLFSFKEKRSLLLGISLPFFLYPLSEKVQHLTPVSTLGIVLSHETIEMISSGVGIIYVGLITLAFYFFAKENERVLKNLNEERSRSISSAKFAALGEMAGGIAHEINNPLMAINVSNENLRFMLKEKDFPLSEAAAKVESISKTVNRVASIIHSMRRFSRDASEDPKQVESLQKIFGETLVFCQERFKNHGVHLEIKFPDNEVFIHCRPVQVSQVLLNVLNNAFDAVEGQLKKSILVEIKNSEENGVLVLISDSGPGVSRKLQDKIFEPFFTTKPAGKGTGLGLSISRQIAIDHGGDLYLVKTSNPTTFSLWFPPDVSVRKTN